MKQTKIKKIERYLNELPDSVEEQVIAFLGYLNYMNQINSEYPYPDELASLTAFKNDPKTYDWKEVKKEL